MTLHTDRLNAYIKTNPGSFKLRAAMHALADALEPDSHFDPRVAESVKSIRQSARALDGICALDIRWEWEAAIKETPWWQRRKFTATEEQWRAARAEDLHAEALDEIETIRRVK